MCSSPWWLQDRLHLSALFQDRPELVQEEERPLASLSGHQPAFVLSVAFALRCQWGL